MTARRWTRNASWSGSPRARSAGGQGAVTEVRLRVRRGRGPPTACPGPACRDAARAVARGAPARSPRSRPSSPRPSGTRRAQTSLRPSTSCGQVEAAPGTSCRPTRRSSRSIPSTAAMCARRCPATTAPSCARPSKAVRGSWRVAPTPAGVSAELERLAARQMPAGGCPVAPGRRCGRAGWAFLELFIERPPAAGSIALPFAALHGVIVSIGSTTRACTACALSASARSPGPTAGRSWCARPSCRGNPRDGDAPAPRGRRSQSGRGPVRPG